VLQQEVRRKRRELEQPRRGGAAKDARRRPQARRSSTLPAEAEDQSRSGLTLSTADSLLPQLEEAEALRGKQSLALTRRSQPVLRPAAPEATVASFNGASGGGT